VREMCSPPKACPISEDEYAIYGARFELSDLRSSGDLGSLQFVTLGWSTPQWSDHGPILDMAIKLLPVNIVLYMANLDSDDDANIPNPAINDE